MSKMLKTAKVFKKSGEEVGGWRERVGGAKETVRTLGGFGEAAKSMIWWNSRSIKGNHRVKQ